MTLLSRGCAFLAIALMFSGCDSPKEPYVARYHFADPSMRATSVRDMGFDGDSGTGNSLRLGPDPDFDVVGIGNDHRYVLAAPPFGWVSMKTAVTVPADGRLVLDMPLPGGLTNAEEFILLPTLSIKGSQESIRPLSVRPVMRNGVPRLPVEFNLPLTLSGKSGGLSVSGYGRLWGKQTRVQTATVTIPALARLEAAFGVLNPLGTGDAVSFQVDVCEANACRTVFDKTVRPEHGQLDIGWESFRIDLAPWTNGDVSFVFRTLVEGPDTKPRLFPVWADPTIFARRASPKKAAATNVILISLDTLSGRHLDLYGYGHDTAPGMTKSFGGSGAVFDNCMAAATATAPSHMTMLTGVHPLEHNVTDGLRPVVKDATSFASIARSEGVETAAFTEDGWVSVGIGFGRGFGRFAEDRSPDVMAPEGQVAKTFGSARAWLSENHDKSFFLFLHTFQVHDPYAPPPNYHGLFRSTSTDTKAGTAPGLIVDRIAYDQEIRYVDDELTLLLQEIERLGIEDSTLVVVTSDHGEAFGEHGFLGHSNYMHEEVLHVPLMMRGPGIGRGVRVSATVGHVDLMPTMLEALGLPHPRHQLRGTSLLQAASAALQAAPPIDRALYSESWGTLAVTSSREVAPFLAPALAVRRGDLKLVRYRTNSGYRYEGYDLHADPNERVDKFVTDLDSFKDLVTLLDGYEAEAARGKQAISTGEKESQEAVRLAPDQHEKLRALGYLQ